jgi:ABC-2 type transport system ATP-binding protein
MQAAIQVDRIIKRFGSRAAVDPLSFDVQRGEVFALLGPNGAGKTTVVRMLVGIIRPDEGRIAVSLDQSTTSTLPPEQTGYLPEDRGLYREVPVLRTLIYFGQLRGLTAGEANRRAHEWLERMSLMDRKNERLDALSKGNQQRVQLITAVMHKPTLAILDEPFSGLDPLSQEFFLDLVQDLKAAGTTILLSAHQMDLVERAADRVLLMNRGREILAGSMSELRRHLDDRPRVRLTIEADGNTQAVREDADVEDVTVEEEEIHITLRPGASVPSFIARIVSLVPIRSIATEAPRLHEVFVRAVRNDDRKADS